MTQQQKLDIVALIEAEKERLGSYAKVARKCSISEATISQMRNQNWELIAEDMWQRVSMALGYRPEGWQLVDTTNTRIVWTNLDNAKREALFLSISHRAGSGKTASLTSYERANREQAVFYISCREWSKKEFLVYLALNCGIDAANRAMTTDALLMSVVAFFKARRTRRPLLILDEADKLKGAALRTLITLYNECEDGMGVVICGTDHLEKQMMADARYNRKGADELVSRFGRRFVHLVGSTLRDVAEICKANGVTETATIRDIFAECEPVKRMVGNTSMEVVEDLRRVKRAVQRELIKQTAEARQAAA